VRGGVKSRRRRRNEKDEFSTRRDRLLRVFLCDAQD
jgi:hypothetical protein